MEAVLLDAREYEHSLTSIFTNPAVQVASRGNAVPAQTLVLRRRRVIHGGLIESLSISNYAQQVVDVDLRIDFDADFRDIFEIRGLTRQSKAPRATKVTDVDRVRFEYDGVDHVRRTTLVRFQPAPQSLTGSSASFALRLEARGSTEIDIAVTTGEEAPALRASEADTRARRRGQEWLKGLTAVTTDNEAVNETLTRAMQDIDALRTGLNSHQYLAAGVPWFDTLFGRDSLIASMEMAPFTTELLRDSLEMLALYQAQETDAAHDATPGKIPHELRWGELANAGEVPFGQYYGSVDVTPLFILAAYDYFRWTSDRDTVARIWPAIQNAMRWCDTHAGDRFLAYSRKSSAGLENQGWKDSSDAIVWPDGQLVEPAISLIEVQGYLAAAYHAYAEIRQVVEGANDRHEPRDTTQFMRRMDDAFQHDELGYVLCLDGQGRPVPTAASNSGHLLWVGAAREDLAEKVARRLMQPDLFSGWGIRTLSSTVAGFNPLGYHTGSVWPHDNALAVAGLCRYGFYEQAQVLATALIEAALRFPNYRLPELFSGDDRQMRHVPTPYPVSSRPQAWAAASVPFVIISMLGICPGRPGQISVTRPALPAGLQWVRVQNLRLAGGSVDLVFHRHGDQIAVETENLRDIDVVLSDVYPDRVLSSR